MKRKIKLPLILALLLCGAKAHAAGQAGFIQQVSNDVASTTATTLATSLGVNGTAGSLLVVGIGLDGANALTATVSSVTDDKSNTYSQVVTKTQSGGINERAAIWVASNAVGGVTTITVNTSGALGASGGIQVIATEYPGVDTGSVASITNATASNSNAASTSASVSITPTQQSLVVAFVNCSPVNAGSSGFRFRANPAVGNALEDKLNATATLVTPAFTLASSDNWAMVAASFSVSTGLTTGVADVQQYDGSAGSPNTLVFTSVDAGNTLVVCSAFGISTNTLTSIKDQSLNVFSNTTNSPETQSSSGRVYISYLANSPSGSRTLTIAYVSSNPLNFTAFELFGVATASFDIDGKAVATTGATISTPSVTSTGSSDVLVSVATAANTVTGTSNGWIMPLPTGTSGTLAVFKNSQSAAAHTSNFTQSSSGAWAVMQAAFKAAGAAPSSPHQLTTLGAGD